MKPCPLICLTNELFSFGFILISKPCGSNFASILANDSSEDGDMCKVTLFNFLINSRLAFTKNTFQLSSIKYSTVSFTVNAHSPMRCDDGILEIQTTVLAQLILLTQNGYMNEYTSDPLFMSVELYQT